MTFFHSDNDGPYRGNIYLTEREAAAVLGMSVKFLQKLRLVGGGIPYSKFGSAVRYRRADILAFGINNRRGSTSEDPSS